MTTSIRKNPLKEAITRTKSFGKNLARFFREEDLLKEIIQSLRIDLRRSEKIIAWLFLAGILCMPVISVLVNSLGQHYETIDSLYWCSFLPGCIFFLFVCLRIRRKRPYAGSLITITFATMMCTVALGVGAGSLLTTPFGHNDLSHALLRLDQWLGFHQSALMNWRQHFPALSYWLKLSYSSITEQVVLTAILLTALRCFKAARLYILTILVCSLFAYVIYYFWPTFAPAYVIHNATFSIDAAHLIERTTGIRAHIAHKLYPGAGLIAFPSCHVIMGLTGIFCWIAAAKEASKTWVKHLLIIVSVISVIVNISLIFATVLLGYHYLVDVLASILIFLVAWRFLYPMVQKEKG